MEAQPKNRWVMSDSEDEEEEEKVETEKIITSLPTVEEAKAPKQKKKKRSKPKEKEEEIDPNLTTKIVIEQKTEAKNLRADGTTASKKEVQKKELDELESILQEFGLQPQEKGKTEAEIHEENSKQSQQKGKAKVSKKEVFENVRAEINARTKKSKKKDKMSYPR
ncbi:unnamed protein product [Blepharisma stoltei]|uniref:Uncharacterized protein n=1 Tax=Blepharisma stoltei TaxID=1481888 RepID=A0AAU9JD83_9CILI|nr:unnamed protein product [Blepharisma stoltei]